MTSKKHEYWIKYYVTQSNNTNKKQQFGKELMSGSMCRQSRTLREKLDTYLLPSSKLHNSRSYFLATQATLIDIPSPVSPTT
jgi:hypothetical protein